MPVQLFEPFSTHPEWLEMAEHVNRLLRERGYYNYEILIRPAAAKELPDPKHVDDFNVKVYFYQVECRLEVVIPDPHSSTRTFSPFDSQTPEEFALHSVVDILDQFLIGDGLDDDNSYPGRSFRIFEGGKKS